MRNLITIVLLFSFISFCCNTKSNKQNNLESIPEDIKYPEHSYICFDPLCRGDYMIESIQLGDSLSRVKKLIALEISTSSLNNCYFLKKPIYINCVQGKVKINALATFDDKNRLYKFEAKWTYMGERTPIARLEFWQIIRNCCYGCLWENSFDVKKTVDTFKTYWNGDAREFYTDFKDSVWRVKFRAEVVHGAY